MKVISHEIYTRQSLDIRFSNEMLRGNICAVDDSSWSRISNKNLSPTRWDIHRTWEAVAFCLRLFYAEQGQK